MEFDFAEFCAGLSGLTEKEACDEIQKKRQRLANQQNFGTLSETEKILAQDWDDQLKKLYRKTNARSQEMFRLNEVIKRDF
jgi:hypothetical protein